MTGFIHNMKAIQFAFGIINYTNILIRRLIFYEQQNFSEVKVIFSNCL